MTIQESMNANGGKTYICPFGCNKTGSYLSVYAHCWSNKCFKRDPWFNGLWTAYSICKGAATLLNFTKALKSVIFPVGKHFK